MYDLRFRVPIFVACCFGMVILLKAMIITTGGTHVFRSGVTAWAVCPFLLLGLVGIFARSCVVLGTTAVVGALCATSTLLYHQTFLPPDAQGALIYLFLPLYQLAGILLSLGAAILFKLASRFLHRNRTA